MPVTQKVKQMITKNGPWLAGLLVTWVVLAPAPALACSRSSCDLITTYVNPIINLLSAVFGLIAVASIIMGGIQYSSSEGDPQKAAKAKDRISNTLFAIFAYALLYGFLQFLVPGGFLN
jgi:hypothetical protein